MVITYASYTLDYPYITIARSGPGHVLSLLPLFALLGPDDGGAVGESGCSGRRGEPVLVHLDERLVSVLPARLALRASFLVDHPLDDFQEVLQGALVLVWPFERQQGGFEMGLRPCGKLALDGLAGQLYDDCTGRLVSESCRGGREGAVEDGLLEPCDLSSLG